MSEDTPISEPPQGGGEHSPGDEPGATAPEAAPANPTAETPAVPTAETPVAPVAPPNFDPSGAPAAPRTPTIPPPTGSVPPAGAYGPAAGWVPPQPPNAPTAPGWGGGYGGGGWSGGWGQPATPGPAAPHPQRSDRGLRVAVAVLTAALVAIGGFFVGRGVGNQNNSASGANAGSQSPSFGVPGFGGSSNGDGSNGTGSNGSGSTGSGNGNGAVSSNVAAKVDPGVVDITTVLGYQNGAAAGTGMVLTSSGIVLTNNHVIAGATSIKATDIGNGKTYTARVLGYSESSDVAVIKLQGASGLKTVTTGDSSNLSTGNTVIAIGNAGGVGGSPTVTSGTVQALNQSITATDDANSNSEQLAGLIETDAELQPGDSGGPLVDSSGHVVGMDTAASSSFSFSSGGSQGFAIPINTALSLASQIRAGNGSDTVHIGATAFLGVGITPDGSSNIGSNGSLGSGSAGSSGATVANVVSGTAAARAGLAAGDTIDSLNGNTINSAAALTAAMEHHHPGDSVQVGWTDANGVQHNATVTLTGGPAA